ncbi:glutaminyl-peptide cyclotransferase [Amycolatopsis marina]|uniref:glutaminyl-peptide cyclotransferase n=1 Tax=Amycolatopsis marina TaxID=490629 RepID=UPI000B822B2E|nr:glutaminyl-peptide cyclotransferase [Amycolatopsis marina]
MISVLLAVAAVATGCAGTPAQEETAPVEQLRVRVEAELPHDTKAFTQGLELRDGTLYEGTGLVGRSSLRAGPPGERPELTAELPSPLFGEGITVVDDRIWQLTWQNGLAIEWDRERLTERRRVPYQGEGWGLCHQPGSGRLVMSDGSARLTFRDPRTFAELGSVTVRADGREYGQLNELECVGDEVYANVWHSDRILRIDPADGSVTAEIDASGLLTADERDSADVLNGIAAVPGSDQFLLTGKLWPKMFRVTLVPADGRVIHK